jgi:hypothetical protein
MSIFHKNHPNLTLQLHPHSLHHLDRVEPGTTVVCEKGLLLLTQTGNPQDYTLRPGQRMVVGGHGKVLIEAVSEAALCILYPN